MAADLRKLALPIWLTTAVLPFIYLVGLLTAYETSFLQIDLTTQRTSARGDERRSRSYSGSTFERDGLASFEPAV